MLIGLVKIVEARIGPSHVDEYAGLASLLFLASACASYASIRSAPGRRLGALCESIADALFLIGLAGISLIAVSFAYEAI